MWSDLRTTYRLLSVGYRPHETVKIPMTCRPKVEVPHGCLDHPGVGLRMALLVCLDGKFMGNVLPQETENIKFLTGDLMQTPLG